MKLNQDKTLNFFNLNKIGEESVADFNFLKIKKYEKMSK